MTNPSPRPLAALSARLVAAIIDSSSADAAPMTFAAFRTAMRQRFTAALPELYRRYLAARGPN